MKRQYTNPIEQDEFHFIEERTSIPFERRKASTKLVQPSTLGYSPEQCNRLFYIRAEMIDYQLRYPNRK